ncbi:MAG: glycosyltransferase family 2 protein [Chromatiales bacterium]|nr:glycosyltransferase family 2 protein [Chromatiales bacterium]
MKVSRPLVSIIVTCYNSEPYLESTLNSVLAQSLTDYEIVIVDDCSTDHTPSILREYASLDPRFVLIWHETNAGRPAISKNTALGHVRGKYVCFLDHDDLYHPRKLEKSVNLLESFPDCIAAFHDIDLVTNDGRVLSRYLDEFLEDADRYLTPGGENCYLTKPDFFKFQSIRYAALHTISAMLCPERLATWQPSFDTQYRICDDTDLWIRLGLSGSMIYLDEVLAYYRQHDSNITRDQLKFDIDVLSLLRRNYQRVTALLNDDERQALRQRLVNTLSDYGWHSRCQGRHRAAIGAYLEAILWQPRISHAINALKAIFPVRH